MSVEKDRETDILNRLLLKNVPHILEKIFFYLDYESYITCYKVCTIWNKLLASETFQNRAKSVYQKELLEDEEKLYAASKAGSLEEVCRILSNVMVDVNCLREMWTYSWTVNGKVVSRLAITPLCVAANVGNKDVAKLLLERGAEPNNTEAFDRTPPQLATICRGKEIVQDLINRQVDPNQITREHYAPLFLASNHGNEELVRVLLDGGALPNIADSRGHTPLHVAAKNNHIDVVKMLLKGDAEPNRADEHGQTALHWVAKKRACRMEVVQMLLEGGAEPNKQDEHGQTALHVAANQPAWKPSGAQAYMVKLLIDGGADPNTEDKDHRTPLHWALQHGHEDVVKLLTRSGVV